VLHFKVLQWDIHCNALFKSSLGNFVGIHIIAMRVAESLSPSRTGECSRNPVARRPVISRKFF
jgi:hypothetical protein